MRCEECSSRACLYNGGCCIEPQKFYSVNNPPSRKQKELVNTWILNNDFDPRRPQREDSRAYYEFIRDIVLPSSRRRLARYDDEDFLTYIGAYQNDVWCEEY